MADNPYIRRVRSINIDIYDILVAFGVTCPARAHAIKKLLCAGCRGHKTELQDLTEALLAVTRALDLQKEEEKTQ